ncbi:MAG: twin-arginine translocation pathway signal protein, partial [Cyclobacteriaceae bacterium]|nr:twin-arginine translocation pathway signal protein [Cyclobacteriaceae bacterium]
MNRRESIKKISLGAITPALLSSCHGLSPFSPDENEVNKFETQWKNWPNMEWIGPEFWGNRLQDWVIENGKAVCRVSEPNRNLQILIAQANKLIKPYKIKTQIQILNRNQENPLLNQVGFMIGAKGRFENYQSSAVFGKGLIAGVNMEGFPFIGDEIHESKIDLNNPIDLQLEVVPKEDQFKIRLSISTSTTKEIELSFESKKTYSNEEVTGNLALYSHFEKSEMPSVSFSYFTLEGEKLTIRPSQTFGPICFAQYTLHNNILKLNAQLAPLEKIEGHKAELQFFRGNWSTEQTVTIHPMARIAAFRIENFSEETDLKYRIKLTIPLATKTEEYFYEGTIHIAPSNLNNLKTAVFSCNADHGFPDQEIPENVLKHKPDLALFLGDQFYESTGG